MSGLKKAVPDILRIVGTAIAIYVGGPAGAAIAFSANAAAADRQRRLMNREARAAYEASLRDRTQLIRSAEMPRAVAYGRVVCSGALVYARAFGADSASLAMVVALAPGHRISAINEVWIGERAVGALDGSGYPTGTPFTTTRNDVAASEDFTASGSATQAVTLAATPQSGSVKAFIPGQPGPIKERGAVPIAVVGVSGTTVTLDTTGYSGQTVRVTYRKGESTSWLRVKKYLGTATQTADADLMAASGGEWTSNHRGRGVPYLALFLTYSESVYPLGLENVKAEINGALLYDPRKDSTVPGGSGTHRANDDSTWEYSTNPALALRDYLTSPLGFVCAAAEIDEALVIAAANVCDELVSVDGVGGTQKRYECNTLLSTDVPRLANLQALVDSMAGYCVWSQGKWRMYAGSYSAPAITLTDADVSDAGDIAVSARVPRAQLFNAVRGTYISPQNAWQSTDFPPVTNATYQTQDGGEQMFADLPLPATIDPLAAQRLAKITLERARQALTVSASFKLTAYRVTPGDIIALTLSRYGFSAKPFRVLEREFSFAGGVRLTLREEAAGVYDWAHGEATTVDLAPNSTLLSPFQVITMPAITVASGSTWAALQGDGTQQPRVRASWTPVTDKRVTDGGALELQYLLAGDTAWRALPALPGDAGEVFIAPATDGAWYQVRGRTRTGTGVRSLWTYSDWLQASGSGFHVGGESLCPDPLFRDVSFWTASLYDTPGWYFQDNTGSNDAADQMDVPRALVLWSGGGSNGGGFTGTGLCFAWSREIPFSSVGQKLRLRARLLNSANRDGGVAVRFRDAAGNVVQDFGLRSGVGAGIVSKSMLLTVPAGTAFLSFYTFVDGPGAAFSGAIAVSEVKLDPATTTEDMDPNSATQLAVTSVATHTPPADTTTPPPGPFDITPGTAASISITTPPDNAGDMDVLVEVTGIARIVQDASGAKVGPWIKLWVSDAAANKADAPDQEPRVDVAASSSAVIPFTIQKRYVVAPNTAKTYYLYDQRQGTVGNTNTTYSVEQIKMRVLVRRR